MPFGSHNRFVHRSLVSKIIRTKFHENGSTCQVAFFRFEKVVGPFSDKEALVPVDKRETICDN